MSLINLGVVRGSGNNWLNAIAGIAAGYQQEKAREQALQWQADQQRRAAEALELQKRAEQERAAEAQAAQKNNARRTQIAEESLNQVIQRKQDLKRQHQEAQMAQQLTFATKIAGLGTPGAAQRAREMVLPIAGTQFDISPALRGQALSLLKALPAVGAAGVRSVHEKASTNRSLAEVRAAQAAEARALAAWYGQGGTHTSKVQRLPTHLTAGAANLAATLNTLLQTDGSKNPHAYQIVLNQAADSLHPAVDPYFARGMTPDQVATQLGLPAPVADFMYKRYVAKQQAFAELHAGGVSGATSPTRAQQKTPMSSWYNTVMSLGND